MTPASDRFTPDARAALRKAILDAGGVEVFAICDVVDGKIAHVTVTCRGTEDAVPALLERPATGQVVVHNHPSGVLLPSGADMALAARYGDDGVGVAIVDNQVAYVQVVVEPHARPAVPVNPDEVRHIFEQVLPAAAGGGERRPAQLQMALGVAEALSSGQPFVVEAGTGTGKSLAYAVPAALWARDNVGRVMISTYTRQLQSQLVRSDLPMLARLGVDVPFALLQGRSNYACKRRLGIAAAEAEHEDDDTAAALRAIVAWDAVTPDGTRSDLPGALRGDVWERVESDSDLTLRVRCPFYDTCHYYVARRRAAAARLVVVNHALLLADLSLRHQEAPGVLPTYARIVLDEAHHLQEAATAALSDGTTARSIRRVAQSLVGTNKRPGVLHRLSATVDHLENLPVGRKEAVDRLARGLFELAGAVADEAPRLLDRVDAAWLDDAGTPVRLTEAVEQTSQWTDDTAPTLAALADQLDQVARTAEAIERAMEGVVVPPDRVQPLLDLGRARRRTGDQAQTLRLVLTSDEDRCRWIARAPGRRLLGAGPGAALWCAPIDVAAVLRAVLWDKVPGVVGTSATLAVNGSFDYWIGTVGLEPEAVRHDLVPSPFDHAQQALLGVPKDLPDPRAGEWTQATAAAVVDAVRASDGGAFVLCTSYAAVRAYADALRGADPTRQVLAQGESASPGLLVAFMRDPRAVLVGTDSFWEGVSVKGDGLRLVVIPRLPFRVPTEPLLQARSERVVKRGGDPFRELMLPATILKLRQGYGRLIRSKTDRGVVVLLDPRVHSRAFGPRVLASLPPARRVAGPWWRVREEVRRFFGAPPTLDPRG
jgi:ATP-dependent DNA helicase DinG